METEIPAMLTARQQIRPERFTFHSSRMRMKTVAKDELAAMDGESDRCAIELSDAGVDVLGYACLVAIMAMGNGYHRASQKRLADRTAANGAAAPVVSSAGALVDGLHRMGLKRIALVAPYMKPLTRLVVDYIEAEGFEVAYLMGGSAILGLVRHAHTQAGPFTPRRIGLDHLSFGVDNRESLVEWASRLDELGVAHNGVEDQAFGAGLTFADPDGTALEFYWLNLPSAAPQN